VVELISQTSANTVCEHLPHRAKAFTNYTEGKVRSGDLVDSVGSNYSPNSEMSDEDEDKDKKQRVAKTKSPSRKEPVSDANDNVDEEEADKEVVSIIVLLFVLQCITQQFCNLILVTYHVL
jgi:hypothetical protein